MTNQDEQRFKDAMDGVCIIYNKEANRMLYKMYFNALSSYDINDIENAIQAHTMDTRSGQFWPKPADIIKHLNSGKSSLEIRNEQQRKKWMEKKAQELSTGLPAYSKDEILRMEVLP